jgi:hypothetical protein
MWGHQELAKVTVGLIFVGVVILMFIGDERPPAASMGPPPSVAVTPSGRAHRGHDACVTGIA